MENITKVRSGDVHVTSSFYTHNSYNTEIGISAKYNDNLLYFENNGTHQRILITDDGFIRTGENET